MSALEDFENTLKEVVNAKRLSASKMNRLTEIAMKSLENDTKLVAVLYRTHKSLPNSAKVSSLYAFDALARAARSLANKRGITGDINSPRGNAATFLLKIEGVLDGLFQDMGSSNNSETKEKTKKVLDIWVKSNTFPSTVLTRLRDNLSDVRKENTVNPTTSVDPPPTTEAPVITTSQLTPQTLTPPASDVQATLLALLSQAAQGENPIPGQTLSNNDPRLQPAQLALLQQLALTAKLASNSPTPPSGPTPPPTDGNSFPAVIPAPEPPHPSARPPQVAPRYDIPEDVQYARNGSQDRGRDQRDFRDERISRGGARGGYRGRGRWDDHHNHDRFRARDRDREPASRPRRSRSRSPRRHEEWRNVRAYSPPRRPLNNMEQYHQRESPTPPPTAHGKDEFGRDIRSSSHSPSRSTSVEDSQALAPMESSVDPTPGVPPDNHIPVSDQLPLVSASTSAESAETRTTTSSVSQQPGLDQFDIGTFDATAPSSWEALGNMWQTTHGYLPSQEELMHFVLTGSMAAAGMANGGFNGSQGGEWQQDQMQEHGPQRNGGWWRGGGRGRGNHYGSGRGGYSNYQDGGGYAHHVEETSEPSSYAIVLNGDAEMSDGPVADNQLTAVQEHSDEQSEGSRGGRMRRVGDKWVFTKDGESGTA